MKIMFILDVPLLNNYITDHKQKKEGERIVQIVGVQGEDLAGSGGVA